MKCRTSSTNVWCYLYNAVYCVDQVGQGPVYQEKPFSQKLTLLIYSHQQNGIPVPGFSQFYMDFEFLGTRKPENSKTCTAHLDLK